jgi:death-on-curing protein
VFEFLSVEHVVRIHDSQLRLFGGLPGIIDRSVLGSAVAAAQNLASYSEPDVFDVAASYLYHIARDHPFRKGNKRTAVGAAMAFLRHNKMRIRLDPDAVRDLVYRVAAGEASRDEAAAFLRSSPHDLA